MLKQLFKLVAVLLLALPLASAQQARVYGEGGNWTQEITGSLATVKNLRVKVDIGSVTRGRRFAARHQLRHSQSFLHLRKTGPARI